MTFYESMVDGLFENLRARSEPTREDRLLVIAEMMKSACCRALQEIREVLRDETLDDPTCFRRIEKIVEIYESIGSGGGGRHDFG